MSRRGNCHDNASAESSFSSLKRERIRRRTYKTREEARQDVFDDVEMFYRPVRKQVRNGMLSPVEFERQQILQAEGVWKTRGYSPHLVNWRYRDGCSQWLGQWDAWQYRLICIGIFFFGKEGRCTNYHVG